VTCIKLREDHRLWTGEDVQEACQKPHLQTLAQQGDTRSVLRSLGPKDFGAQLVVSLMGKPL
jgi:hypothetical protein